MAFPRHPASRRFSLNYCKKESRKRCPLHLHTSISKSSNKRDFSCQATTETEPESPDEKEKEVSEDGTSPSIANGTLNSGSTDNQNKDETAITESSRIKTSLDRIDSILRAQGGIQNKDESATTESSDLKDSIGRIDGVLGPPDSIEEKVDEMEVASGSPLPGMKQLGEPIMIPKATIDIIKDQVFGFDTFFVTSQEPYEQGVLFKGNLRGKASTSYEKITMRMQDRFGDQYRLFLLINPEDDEPVAVIVPKQSLQQESTAVPEWFAASAFGLVTIFTLLLRNVPALQSNLLYEVFFICLSCFSKYQFKKCTCMYHESRHVETVILQPHCHGKVIQNS